MNTTLHERPNPFRLKMGFPSVTKLKNGAPPTLSSSPPLKFYSTSILDPNPLVQDLFSNSLYSITLLQKHTENDKQKEVLSDEETVLSDDSDIDLYLSPHANIIVDFLDPFLDSLKCKTYRIQTPNIHVNNSVPEEILEFDLEEDTVPDIVDSEIITPYINSYCVDYNKEEIETIETIEDMMTVVHLLHLHSTKNKEKVNNLLKEMNLERLAVPFIELQLPSELILSYNELEKDDPQIDLYQRHPLISSEIRQLGVFLDRYDTNKDVLCLFIWSTVDNLLISIPCIGLNPYPMCWKCSERFGKKSCGSCIVAKYCSAECQSEHWPAHKMTCPEISYFTKKHVVLHFE